MAAILGFFTISGFSIAHSLTEKPEGFYIRRVARIYPVYLACLLGISILFFLLVPRQESLYGTVAAPPGGFFRILVNLLLLQTTAGQTILGPSWTLAIEAWLYVLAPLLLRMNRNGLFVFALASAFFYLYGNSRGWYAFVWPNDHGLKFCLFIWAWMAGFLYYLEKNSARSLLFLAAGIPLGMLYDAPAFSPITSMTTLLVLYFAPRIKLSLWTAPIFNYLGNISYPMYLSHVCVFIALRGIWGITNGLVHLGVTLGVSGLLYHLVDIPARRFISCLRRVS